MNEYENRAKRLKVLICEKAKLLADQNQVEMEKMIVDSEKKSNFSSINPSNGAIVRANAKGDVKKLVIKNFKSEYAKCDSFRSTMRENLENKAVVMEISYSFSPLYFSHLEQLNRRCLKTIRRRHGRS